jgi:DNA mismatch endonuclease (patch repair protein)
VGTEKSVALGGGVVVPYPHPTSAFATEVGKANRRTGTRPEVRLRSALHRYGLRFRKDYALRVDDGRVIKPDIVFTRARLAVFVDGCFWHACPQHGTTPRSNTDYWGPKLARNVARDRTNELRLQAEGWSVLRVWEHTPVEEAVSIVVQTLEATQPP